MKIKKSITLFLLCSIALSLFAGCNGNSKNNENSVNETTNFSTVEISKQQETHKNTSNANYIGDRSVQYDKATQQHLVFFSFSEYEDSNYLTPDADIHIKIVNNNGDEVYNKTTSVTVDDYAMWTNQYQDLNHLMGTVYIPDNDITLGSTPDGTLTLSADVAGGYSFEEKALNIYDLPLAEISISTPNLPIEINEYNYKNELKTTISVEEMSFEGSEYGSLTVKLKAKMLYNSEGDNKSSSPSIGYKIKDENDIVVGSGSMILNAIKVGETVSDTSYINGDYVLGKKYTMELLDTE